MNIIECYQLLNEYFNKKPCFNVKKNRKEIFLVSDDENAENAALICSLKEMEKANVLRSCSLGGEDYWVLVKPLESFSQTLEISGLLAAGISSIINEMCQALGSESEKCDCMNITEKDLKNLIYIASKASVDSLKK
jgi:hypothetical protein